MPVTSAALRRPSIALSVGALLIGTAAISAPVAADGHAPLEHIGSFFVADNLAEGENRAAPAPLGTIDVGDPTSAAVAGDVVLVSVNTSESFTEPSGELLVIGLDDREVVATLPLSGQPDAVAPSGTYAAIAIENERDEDSAGSPARSMTSSVPPGSCGMISPSRFSCGPTSSSDRSMPVRSTVAKESSSPAPRRAR